ncbi:MULTISPECIES: TetR/AcrR family transcriptional regulator [Hallella]|uniref:TetR/AcrR family transcriptional regulator n=1 Tax=Hallella faecis TaxID=2841596 RepID=A0ABV1FSC1_9BACT|nr:MULTISPECIES: TetR/AcrR family transcriptional regulator [Hallella]MBU0290569.1 TetR/AcrR family transcriptional regulator [Hallella faecis]MDR3845014.1 TetR/AcrR family transcriptional regulator [Hallella sp.]MDY5926061.1 TetR/AcrR family transcriptional regulator [Hallella sp.]
MTQPNYTTEHREALREQILKVATREFTTIGVKSVKMDDIARKLKISKRTLYEIYDNKEQLLLESVARRIHEFDATLERFDSSGEKQVIDILLEFYRLQMEELRDMNPVYYEDLHKYPRVMSFLEQVNKEHKAHSKDFFKRGVLEGYFRNDFNYELISLLGNNVMQNVMESKLYNTYSLQDIFRNVVMLFIRGLCTAKGILELDRQLESRA